MAAYNESIKNNMLRYQKDHVQQVKFNFHKENDADILEYLEAQPNKLGYIKSLIRADIAKSAQNKEEKEMKKWYIIDDATTARGQIFDNCTNTDDMDEALQLAQKEWNQLTKDEQEKRDDFYIALGAKDEDDCLDWNSVTKCVSFKSRYHIQPDHISEWGSDTPMDYVVTLDEVINLSREWETPVSDLLEQLEEI